LAGNKPTASQSLNKLAGTNYASVKAKQRMEYGSHPGSVAYYRTFSSTFRLLLTSSKPRVKSRSQVIDAEKFRLVEDYANIAYVILPVRMGCRPTFVFLGFVFSVAIIGGGSALQR